MSARSRRSHGIGWDAVEQFAPVGSVERRRLAGFDNVLRAAHGRRQVYWGSRAPPVETVRISV